MIENLSKKDMFAIGYTALLSVLSLIYGFSVIPSPATQQVIATDQKRVVDLANIKEAVDNYYRDNNQLPQSLDILTTQAYDPSTPLQKIDPQTQQPYDYSTTSQFTYMICATFATDSSKTPTNADDTTSVDYPTYKDQFSHPAGHFCFTEREQPPMPMDPLPPTKFHCQGACPMIPADSSSKPSPAIYNGNQITVSPSPLPNNIYNGSAQ